MLKCVDCGGERKAIRETGSFLCDTCFEKLAARLKNAVKGRVDVDKRLEEVKRLLKETDLTISEIAEKTGRPYSSVYYHANMIRGEKDNHKESELKQVKKENERLKERISVLEDEIQQLANSENHTEKMLAERIDKLEQLLEKEKRKHDALLEYVKIAGGY